MVRWGLKHCSGEALEGYGVTCSVLEEYIGHYQRLGDFREGAEVVSISLKCDAHQPALNTWHYQFTNNIYPSSIPNPPWLWRSLGRIHSGKKKEVQGEAVGKDCVKLIVASAGFEVCVPCDLHRWKPQACGQVRPGEQNKDSSWFFEFHHENCSRLPASRYFMKTE